MGSDLTTSIKASQIRNNTLTNDELSTTNAAVDNYVLSYDESTGKFTWVAPGAGIYKTSFVNANLTAGVLTVNHSLSSQWQLVSIYDNNNKLIFPDEITLTDSDNCSVDLSSHGAISGTWNVIVVGIGGTSVLGIDNIVEDLTPQLGGDLDMNGHSIGGNTEAQIDDAVTKKHTQNSDTDLDATFEATFVKKTDTANVLSDITSTGANIEDAVTKKHTQGTDTALGAQSEDLDMNTHKISGVVDPIADQDAATKKHVADNSINNLSEDTTPQLGGELDCQAHSIGFTEQTATGDGTTTIDWKLGNKFKFTFGAFNEVFTFTAPTKPCNILLILKQDATGSRTATFPATVKWADGVTPTLSTGANAIDIVCFYYAGDGNYYGQFSGNFS